MSVAVEHVPGNVDATGAFDAPSATGERPAETTGRFDPFADTGAQPSTIAGGHPADSHPLPADLLHGITEATMAGAINTGYVSHPSDKLRYSDLGEDRSPAAVQELSAAILQGLTERGEAGNSALQGMTFGPLPDTLMTRVAPENPTRPSGAAAMEVTQAPEAAAPAYRWQPSDSVLMAGYDLDQSPEAVQARSAAILGGEANRAAEQLAASAAGSAPETAQEIPSLQVSARQLAVAALARFRRPELSGHSAELLPH